MHDKMKLFELSETKADLISFSTHFVTYFDTFIDVHVTGNGPNVPMLFFFCLM